MIMRRYLIRMFRLHYNRMKKKAERKIQLVVMIGQLNNLLMVHMLRVVKRKKLCAN